MQFVRIILADDHPVVRSGYRRLITLHPDMEVVAEFDHGESACEWLRHHEADVLILDISMPGQGGFQTLRHLRAHDQRIKVIVLTMHDSPGMAQQAFDAGADGFLSKTSAPDELIESIPRVVQGLRVSCLGPDSPPQTQPSLPHEELSPREFTVMLKLAEGLSAKEAAHLLSLSDKTTYNYQTKIYRKLGIDNGVQLTQYVQRHQLLK